MLLMAVNEHNERSTECDEDPPDHLLTGYFVKKHDNAYLHECREGVAHISLTDGKLPDKPQFSITRNFFDENSERLYLKACAHGYSKQHLGETSLSSVHWEEIKYMSRVRHTWYFNKIYEANTSHVRLIDHAIQLLKTTAKKLSQSKPDDEGVRNEIRSFFNKFGSHVSSGPFATGGRCIMKVSSSNLQGLDKRSSWELLENEFENLNPRDVLSTGCISITRRNKLNEIVGVDLQVCLFGGNSTCKELNQWENELALSKLVFSCDVSESNLMPLWKIMKVSKSDLEGLCPALEDVWSELQATPDSTNIATVKNSPNAIVTQIDNFSVGSSNSPAMYDAGTVNNFPTILEKLKLSKKKQGLYDANTLRNNVWNHGDFTDNAVMWRFIWSICSLDGRGRTCVKMSTSIPASKSICHQSSVREILGMVDFNKHDCKTRDETISSMDVTLAILHCCDSFLRQELLWKMTECRLAVPILLPYLDSKKVEIQIWGLRKIYKSWKPWLEKSLVETPITDYPLPVVSFLRLGDICFSKSRLLNKILGKLHGNTNHPYFVDEDEETPCAKWSKGTIESAWYIPEDRVDTSYAGSLRDAVTFFNLRGDALDFPVQTEFACRASDVAILLVKEDRYKEIVSVIEDLSDKVRKHLVCLISSTRHQNEFNTIQGDKLTLMFSKPSLEDIGAELCKELNRVLWSEEIFEPQYKFQSLYSLKKLSKELDIDIDEDKDCIEGEMVAKEIINNIRGCSDDYKKTYLPLRGMLWQKWSTIDKKWNKGYDHSFLSVEHYRDDLKEKLRKVREKQRNTDPSEDVVRFIKAFERPSKKRKYFVDWLNVYLNDLCHENLGPRRRELQKIQDKSRALTAQKSNLKDNSPNGKEYESMIASLEKEEIALQHRAYAITEMIGKQSLGIEHFVREIGQNYEAYDALKGLVDVSVDSKINPADLPHVAVKLLLDGYPLEILDGDVGQVPIRWIKAVFKSLIERLGDVKVCAISVLGIQSSGKSTLLNCMFGVRFAVSAGRCTRGVFIQLLKVHEHFKKVLNCDYLIVIDTEGLRAPERCIGYNLRYDNELATFAMCIADLTIINIAGQTVGKDMTDVLQIAAHAFIRMKEVHIKSSCRIVQQFVADIGAVEKNKASTQAILTKSDEAISAAATEEGYSDLYSCFSDVFNLNLNVDIQYIPSLWQGAMAPPNHRYSEKIMKLKNVLFNDLRDAGKPLGQFCERLTTVWKAVKEENFIFSFQNCIEAVQYKIFQHWYGVKVGDMRQAVMKWESNAKQRIKTVSIEKTEITKTVDRLKTEVNGVVNKETAKVEESLNRYLSDDVTGDNDQLIKLKDEFLKDLRLTKRIYKQDAREALDRIAASITQRNHMGVFLPKCRKQLREKAKKEAVDLRKKHSDVTSLKSDSAKNEIYATFDKLWEEWIQDICELYPPSHVKEDDVNSEFALYLIQAGEKCDLSNGLKERLMEKEHESQVRRVVKGAVKGVKGVLGASNSLSINHKEIAENIIGHSLHALQLEIDDDFAYDPQIKQKLIDSAINALNKKYDGTSLTQNIKVEAMVDLCQRAVPIIYKGRLNYNEKYSLQELLTKEKENLKKDFVALCSNAFQNKRASECLITLLTNTTDGIIVNSLGHAIYKAVLEKCPYLASKFSMFGNILEDLAEKENFKLYHYFIFDLEMFIDQWTLEKIAEVCARKHGNQLFLHHLVKIKAVEIQRELLQCISSCGSSTVDIPPDRDNERFQRWVEIFWESTRKCDIHLPDDDMNTLQLFEVNDLNIFGDEVKKYVECQMITDVLHNLNLPNVEETEGQTNEQTEEQFPKFNTIKKFLITLPDQPHLEIKKHVTGCMKQCPFCKAPCDNMTREHDKHRAELHYPEGIIGCGTGVGGRLVCSICTSIVTTDETYNEGKNNYKYKDYQKHFPEWTIQPVENDSPIKYWQWVMNYFNKDFSELYSLEEAKLPNGWIEITKQAAIEDLKRAYATNARIQTSTPN